MNNGNEGFENLKEIENLKKEIDLVREDGQATQLQLEKQLKHKDDRIRELEQISKEHQDQNGKLQKRLSQYEDKAAHYRRKAVL